MKQIDNPVPGSSKHLRLGTVLLGILLVIVLLRSAVIVLFPHAHSDSDEAVLGLMGKHIAERKAFPLFMYGQRYLLAVGSWLSAPLFLLFGVSVTTLKAPMLALNLASVCLIWVGLRREPGIGPWGAAIALLPFAVPNVIVTTRLLFQSGMIEPFFFVSLIYLLRERPWWLGLVLGIGFLNREYTLLGFIALIAMDVLAGSIRTRWRGHLISVFVVVIVMKIVRFAAEYTANFKGNTATGAMGIDTQPTALLDYLTVQVPTLLGSTQHRLHDYNIASTLSIGHHWLTYVVIAWALVMLAGVFKMKRAALSGMPVYLLLVGLGQTAAFCILVGAPRDPMLIRYVLLTLLIWVGATALAWQVPRLRYLLVPLTLLVCGANAWDHARLAHEYATHTPHHENELLMHALLKRGVRYANAEFWIAYDVTFMTNEKIIMALAYGEADKIARYRSEVDRNREHAVNVLNEGKPGCEHVLRWFICPP